MRTKIEMSEEVTELTLGNAEYGTIVKCRGYAGDSFFMVVAENGTTTRRLLNLSSFCLATISEDEIVVPVKSSKLMITE